MSPLRNNLPVCWLYLLVLLTVASPLLHASPPSWWTTRGVIDTTKQANDYAAVNQGQVKFIAEQAMEEMETYLPGGIGGPTGAIHTMVDAWGTPTATTNDFTPVNLGMLKHLAAPFYDQLIRVGYVNAYPWTGSLAQANDFAAANIGQVKNLFSFDLISVGVAHDSNGDGLPDWWENYFHLTGIHATDPVTWNPNLTYLQTFQQGLNPKDPFDGQPPMLSIVGGDQQTAGAGGFAPQALAIQVLVKGIAVCNTPVTFPVAQGGGQVQATASSTPASTVTVTTNASGIARTFFVLPNASAGTVCEVDASAGTGTEKATRAFHETVGGSNYDVQNAASSISNLVGVFNADGSEDLTWRNNTDDPVPIWKRDATGAWVPFTTLPAGTTSYHMINP